MLKFYPATIVSKKRETDDSVAIVLSVADDTAPLFRYSQGQHLPVRARIGGADLRRTYSICAAVGEQTLRLGIRVQGAFSRHIADTLNVGDTLEAMPPAGHFQTTLDPAQSKTYAAFVAGSGITPVLSIVKTTLETEATSRFVVFYGNRKRSTTMFAEELWGLKNLYPDRLALHFVMSREDGDIPVYEGRIDAGKVKTLHESFLTGTRPDEIFVCGPNRMIDDVRESLLQLGYDPRHIHTERFRTEQTGAAPEESKAQAGRPAGTIVTVVMDGNRQSFEMHDTDQTLLDAALDEGLDLPYSCMGGVCSTCRTRLAKGKVDMAVNYALEEWELEAGYILACQSRPQSAEIELDYDQA